MIAVDRLRAVIPACLLELAQWVDWKYLTRKGKPTKVPIHPRTGEPASSTDPSTWGSFEQAIAAFQNIATVEGVGFVFTQGDLGDITGINKKEYYLSVRFRIKRRSLLITGSVF